MATLANVIDVPVKGTNEVVTIDCSDLPHDPSDFCAILSAEEAEAKYWVRLASEYRRISQLDQAIEILIEGLKSRPIVSQNTQRYYLHSLLASLYIQKSRDAATGMGQQIDGSNQQTKDTWHKKALQSLNDAARLKPMTTFSTLTRGVLSILAATKERLYDDANKQFDNALRENAQNVFAILGKARVLYARNNLKLALGYYQKALRLRPTVVPDPRIGIGLCYWQLGMKEDALAAWERTLELDSTNVSGATLLGMYWIAKAFECTKDDLVFQNYYTKGLKLLSDVYKINSMPLAGVALAAYMFSAKKMDAMHNTLQKVLIMAEVPATRADALLWLGRGQHEAHSFDQASAFYALAKQTEPDNLIASIAVGQMQLARQDLTDAKLTFESILERNPKCIEVLAVLGSIYAQDALDSTFKGDKLTHRIKAKACLDKAIALTADHKHRTVDDANLHFVRSMLADDDPSSIKLRVLEQAADIQSANGSSSSPEVLNNMAVAHQQEGSFDLARDLYQRALDQCMQADVETVSQDIDTKMATITYNLGRCEENSGRLDAAREIYSRLIYRYPDYVEPAARLAYMDYIKTGSHSVLDTMRDLVEMDPNNVEVRALYGWLLNKQKKDKNMHFNEDPERKHFNHTLKYIDNYERYSLVSLGNFYLKLARETRADNETGAAERYKHYDMAIKFFERALHYDPKNAYAAQGLGIAFAEHKQYQKALNIFSKVRETIRDESILLNMGHCLCELHQYSRAIENYEMALNSFHADSKDRNLFLCLGRAWLSRGREEKNVEYLREALEYTKKAQQEMPQDTSMSFNVAFVQFQIADVLRNTPELKRTVIDLEKAFHDLEDAIKSFTVLAEHKYPPYPKSELMQRATMGRNTTTKQLERAIQQQKEFELKNAEKVAEAKAKREADRSAREAAQAAVRDAELERQNALIQKRKEMQERARSWAEKRHQDEEESALRDAERAQKKEKKSRNKKSKDDENSDDQVEDDQKAIKKSAKKRRGGRKLRKASSDAGSPDEGTREASASESDREADLSSQPAKKRKLTKKFASAEFIDSEDDADPVATAGQDPMAVDEADVST